MQIAQHIHTLLLEHDCVSIPDFGGMVTQRFRAEINDGTHMVRPPSKRISYHKDLVANAHLLLNRVAEQNKISPAKASEQIAATVNAWKEILANGQSVKLEGVGRFYLDKEGFVCFNQSLESNFDLDAFGLDMFRATAIKRDHEIKEAVTVAISESVAKTNTRFPLWRAAAVFAGIGILLAVGFLKTDISIADKMTAGFNPLHYSRTIENAPAEIKDAPEITIVKSPETAISSTSPEVVVKPKADETPVVKTINTSEMLPYQVIVGSFKEAHNATDLMVDLKAKGYNPVIIEDNSSYTKVSIEGFKSRTQAVQAMRAYKLSVNKSAWIFSK